jgi:hypothetical protein
MAMFRELQTKVRADLGTEMDDDALLYEVARRAQAGPDDEGRSSYQVAVTRCADCGQANIDAGGHTHPVDGTVAEMAECDAQRIGRVDESPHAGAASEKPKRATQTIPPATRRAVMRRDRKRCTVPGCNNHRFLDVHHLDLRSEGGGHDPERLSVLCGVHHRAAHAGHLVIDGSASEGFTFRHADGRPYGAPLHPAALDAANLVQSALTNLGFKPSQARGRIEAVQRAGAPTEVGEFLRAALRVHS